MKRAVLFVVDGLRADMATAELTPHLAAIGHDSRVFVRQRAVFPSATRVSSASIATGCRPGRHGLAGNAIALDEGGGLKPVSVGPADFRDRWRRATGGTLHRPTLAERLHGLGGVVIHSNSSAGAAHMQDPDGHGTLYHRSGSFGPGLAPITGPEHLDVTYDGAGDRTTTERFVEALLDDPAVPLNVLWICEPDHSQHVLELGSPEHRTVLLAADGHAGLVADAVTALRARGDDVLLIACSDHGHETVDEIVPVAELMVEAGLKQSVGSSDTVVASSGMGALVYLAAGARDRCGAIHAWLSEQPWTDRVYSGDGLREIGHRGDTDLAVAFGMAKRDGVNRFGVPGLGHVALDPFTSSDASGRGQHGGFGAYETNPVLMVSGGGFAPGLTDRASSVVDIAPTILRHLGVAADGMDGTPLPKD